MERHASSSNCAPSHVGLISCPYDGAYGPKIQLLGIEVQHIPGGCTYLCQPVDIGINKPIKKLVAEQWKEWVDTEGVREGTAMKTPSQELISLWVGEAYWMLNMEMCKSAWIKKGYEWKI